MVKTNGAFPMPPFDPRFYPGCQPKKEEKGMNYIGRRSNEWLENKVDAKDQEVYYNEDTNEYWMSIGYNRWEKWQGVGASPVPPTTETEIYIGSLEDIPEDISALDELEKIAVKTQELIDGYKTTISADDAYVVIAYKSSIGPISSILEDGFEAVSDFETYNINDYVFYCTSDTVYDPDAEINYTILWGIN